MFSFKHVFVIQHEEFLTFSFPTVTRLSIL